MAAAEMTLNTDLGEAHDADDNEIPQRRNHQQRYDLEGAVVDSLDRMEQVRERNNAHQRCALEVEDGGRA